jgi:hypothetical protein
VSPVADRVEEFANRFIPRVEILTTHLVRAQRWAKIDPRHPDAVAVRKEIVKIDSEFTPMLSDLVKLVHDCQPYVDSSNAAAADLDYETRIAPALAKMTAAIKAVTKEKEHYAALPIWVEEIEAEFLIGSGRFFS